jgi:hypothetical protein
MGDEGRDERRRWEREVRVENFRSLHLWCSGRGGWRVGAGRISNFWRRR